MRSEGRKWRKVNDRKHAMRMVDVQVWCSWGERSNPINLVMIKVVRGPVHDLDRRACFGTSQIEPRGQIGRWRSVSASAD